MELLNSAAILMKRTLKTNDSSLNKQEVNFTESDAI